MSKSISVFRGVLCFLLGVMPVTKYFAALSFIVFSFPLGMRRLSAQAFKISWPVILYCLMQLGLLFSHPGLLAFDNDLAIVYLIIGFAANPVSAALIWVLGEPKKAEKYIFIGLIGAAAFLGWEYLIDGAVRATGYSSNPLIPPFILVPFSTYILVRRFEERRSSIFDVLVVICVICASGLFVGGRMAFYSMAFLYLVFIVYLFMKGRHRSGLAALGFIFVTIFGVMYFDSLSSSQFSRRIQSQVKSFEFLFENIMSSEAKAGNAAEIYFANTENFDGEKPSIPSVFDSVSSALLNYDVSSYQRWVMWSNSISHLYSRGLNKTFFYGIGRIEERKIVNEHIGTNYSHAHNQFLSWLISGGILSLLSGLLLVLSSYYKLAFNFRVSFFVLATVLGFFTASPLYVAEASAQFMLLVLVVRTFEFLISDGV